MVTKTVNKKAKAVKKKAVKAAPKKVVDRVSITKGQLNTIVLHYQKTGKKVPAFLTKKML